MTTNQSHIEFTEGELEVIKLSAQGMKPKEIADTLYVSVKTVNAHYQNIQKKYNFDSIISVILYCVQQNLFDLERIMPKNS